MLPMASETGPRFVTADRANAPMPMASAAMTSPNAANPKSIRSHTRCQIGMDAPAATPAPPTAPAATAAARPRPLTSVVMVTLLSPSPASAVAAAPAFAVISSRPRLAEPVAASTAPAMVSAASLTSWIASTTPAHLSMISWRPARKSWTFASKRSVTSGSSGMGITPPGCRVRRCYSLALPGTGVTVRIASNTWHNEGHDLGRRWPSWPTLSQMKCGASDALSPCASTESATGRRSWRTKNATGKSTSRILRPTGGGHVKPTPRSSARPLAPGELRTRRKSVSETGALDATRWLTFTALAGAQTTRQCARLRTDVATCAAMN